MRVIEQMQGLSPNFFLEELRPDRRVEFCQRFLKFLLTLLRCFANWDRF